MTLSISAQEGNKTMYSRTRLGGGCGWSEEKGDWSTLLRGCCKALLGSLNWELYVGVVVGN